MDKIICDCCGGNQLEGAERLFSKCHPGAGFTIAFVQGLLIPQCSECGEVAAVFRAEEVFTMSKLNRMGG